MSEQRTWEGTSTLLRFMLRRDRLRLFWWLLTIGALMAVQSAQSQTLYDTPQDLANLRATLAGNAAVIAMSGPAQLVDTIGGEIVFEIFAFLCILAALMSMFLIGRHTRADEEAGRAELIRSARVGRHAIVAAAFGLAGLANLAAGSIVFVVAIATGLPAGGSALVGAGIATVGLVSSAVTAVGVQIFENARGAYGLAALVLGASYVLRAAGDVGDGTLSWLSPIGWGQRTFPYSLDRWWPLLLPVATTVLLMALSVVLLNHRDFGAGLLPPRPGRANASAVLRSATGLAWRLQRGALIGWGIGVFLLGVAVGSIGDTIEAYVADNPDIAAFLPGGAADAVNAFLAVTLGLAALITSAYGVTSVARARTEETSGRAEPILATATSRSAFLISHLGVALLGSALIMIGAGLGTGLAYAVTTSDAGQVARLTTVSLAYVPAVWLIVAITALAVGWLPRAAASAAWVLVGYCTVITLFADSFGLPQWSRAASPFAHTPDAPLDGVRAAPLLIIGTLAGAMLAAGLAGFRRRDVG